MFSDMQNPVRGEKNTRSETHCLHENQAHKEIMRMVIIKVLFHGTSVALYVTECELGTRKDTLTDAKTDSVPQH